jgi:hypothetical protein
LFIEPADTMIIRTFLLSITAAMLAVVSPARALTTYALTDTGHLLVFDSGNPSSVTDKGAITGIGLDTLVGLTIRTTTQTLNPANPGVGSIWVIGHTSTNFHLYIVDPSSAAASMIGGTLTGISTSAGDDAYGFGFDPATDRFRLTSVQFNYQIDPNTITLVQQSSFAGFPAQSGAAFTTASFGGTSVFYNINRDASPDVLQASTDISTGQVSVVGSLGLGDTSAPEGLTISDGTALLATGGTLYSLNLGTGGATSIGAISGSPNIRGLAIMPSTFPPTLSVTVKISGPKVIITNQAAILIRGRATCQAGIKLVQYRVGNGPLINARGTTSWRLVARRLHPGVNVVRVRATGNNDVVSAYARVRVVRL